MLWLKRDGKAAPQAKGEVQPRPGAAFAGKGPKEEPHETAQEARKDHYEREAELWAKRKNFAEAGNNYEQAAEGVAFGKKEFLLKAIECYLSAIKEEGTTDPLVALKISEVFGKIGKKDEAAEWEQSGKQQLAALQADEREKGIVDLARLKRFVMSDLYAGNVLGATVLSYQALLIAKGVDSLEPMKNWVLDTFSSASEEMPALAESITKNLGKLMAV